MSHSALIVGCGDTGCHVARALVQQGEQVTGWVRSQDSAEQVQATGAQAVVCDLDNDSLAPQTADTIYYFAPPPRQGTSDPRLARFLASLENFEPQRLVYISTSGVYGPCDGQWVDEQRPVNPQTDRAKRRVAAENALAAWNGPWVVLRAPGIYGPGRLPLDKVRAGEPVVRDEECGWSNRVHIQDLAAMAVLAASQGKPQRVYNASDGHPTKMAPYYKAIAELLGVPAPPEIDWATAQQEFSAMRLSFLQESRRLDNRRIREELGYEFLYPDIRAGLAASITPD